MACLRSPSVSEKWKEQIQLKYSSGRGEEEIGAKFVLARQILGDLRHLLILEEGPSEKTLLIREMLRQRVTR
jgi:hypothetical protein